MCFLFAPGHEGCRDQGTHREWQRTSPARSVYQVNVYPLVFGCASLSRLCIAALMRHCCRWHFCSCIPSYVGNVEIDVEVKRYFCKAGVKGIQVCLTFQASTYYLTVLRSDVSSIQRCCPSEMYTVFHSVSIYQQFSQTSSLLLCLQLHGMMRVILEPLIGDVPIVGAVTMFFIKRPVRPSTLTSIRPPIPVTIMYLSIVSDAFHAIDFS